MVSMPGSGVTKRRHETVFHVLLDMTVKQRGAGLVSHQTHRGASMAGNDHRVVLDAGGGLAVEIDKLERVPVHVQWVGIVCDCGSPADSTMLPDALAALRVTVAEDRPPKGDSVVPDQLEDTTVDLTALLHQAQEAIRAARREGNRIDPNHARRALTVCQSCIQKIEKQYWNSLTSHEGLSLLARLGSKLGGKWVPWAATVRRSSNGPFEPLHRPLPERELFDPGLRASSIAPAQTQLTPLAASWTMLGSGNRRPACGQVSGREHS